jgi:solute carrier family 25 (mitochondrial phosphate transporter), member 3
MLTSISNAAFIIVLMIGMTTCSWSWSWCGIHGLVIPQSQSQQQSTSISTQLGSNGLNTLSRPCPSTCRILQLSAMNDEDEWAVSDDDEGPATANAPTKTVDSSAMIADRSSSSFRSTNLSAMMNRRELLLSMTAVATTVVVPTIVNRHANAAAAIAASIVDNDSNNKKLERSLEDIQFGHGSWEKPTTIKTKTNINADDGYDDSDNKSRSKLVLVPASFVAYLTRFLLNYDEGVSSWWTKRRRSYDLLSPEQQQARLGRDFGTLATSLQETIQQYLSQQSNEQPQQQYERLFEILTSSYYYDNSNNIASSRKDEIGRQLCLLAATLPENLQPQTTIEKLMAQQQPQHPSKVTSLLSTTSSSSFVENLSTDLSLLLSTDYSCRKQPMYDGSGSSSMSTSYVYTIQPPIALYQIGLGEEFGQSATATPFGPLASTALTRDRPNYTFDIYALFGISGATGCALTHSLVIPLDVVKTKAQTNPDDAEYSNLVVGAQRILDEEGASGLLTGAQATLAGYFWYGLSVYPSYAFFKRWLFFSVLPIDVAIAHANDIALVAGALAAVIASMGLTPLEAARIRVVADPDRYRPLGLIGTLQVIAEEGRSQPTQNRVGTNTSNHHYGNASSKVAIKESLQSLYAGLPSLMTRQVIFGSMKFLAFERACEAIYAVSPSLRDTTWTNLMVSLVAGGFSGALSSFVSQPADAVLTYVAAAQEAPPAIGSTTSAIKASGSASTATALAAETTNQGGGMGVLEGCRLMIEESGPSSLFRGLGSRSLWAAAIIAGQFLLYDVFRSFFGVNSNDLIQVFQIEM